MKQTMEKRRSLLFFKGEGGKVIDSCH